MKYCGDCIWQLMMFKIPTGRNNYILLDIRHSFHEHFVQQILNYVSKTTGWSFNLI